MAVNIPAANRTVVEYKVNGDKVSVMTQGQEQQLNDEQKEAFKQGAVIFPELHYESEGYKTELLGVETVDGKQLNVVQITTPQGEMMKDYFDVDSGLKVKQETSGNGNVSVTSYGNYQDVNGIKLPFAQTSDAFGQNIDLKMQEAKINSGLKDSDFQ